MRFLSKKEEFISEKVFLNLVNESRIYYSPKLSEWIETLYGEEPIANKLSLIETGELDTVDITLIDFAEKPGYLTYTTEKNIKNNISKYPELIPDFNPEDNFMTKVLPSKVDKYYKDENEIWKKSRNTIKLGVLLNSLFPGQFDSSQIEAFTNKMKSFQSDGKVKIVEGEEIRKWYLEVNYLNDDDPLGSSCMRYEKCQPYLDIYVKNPDVCKMAICLQGDKLVARALIWKVTTKSKGEFEWFMDRRYYCIESYNQTLIDHAVENGWAYRATNTFVDVKNVIYKGEKFNCDMTVELDENISYKKYPYVDTFRRFYPETAILENENEVKGSNFIILNHTSGSFTPSQESRDDDDDRDDEDMVWSEYEGEMIHIDDAVYVSRGWNRNHGWYRTDSGVIEYCEDISEYVYEEDARYSEYWGYSIYADNAVWVLASTRNYFDGDYVSSEDGVDVWVGLGQISHLYWYKILKYRLEEYDGILTDILVKDWKGDWILKDYQIRTYCLTSEELEKLDIPRSILIYLSKADAEILGIQIEGDERVCDVHEYNNDLLDLKKENGLDFWDRLKSKAENLDLKRFGIMKKIEELR
jgi:hypothetical protein